MSQRGDGTPIYVGYGAEIEIEGDVLTLTKEGLAAKATGTVGSRRIPLAAIAGVNFKDATRLVNGWLQIVVGGVPPATRAKSAPNSEAVAATARGANDQGCGRFGRPGDKPVFLAGVIDDFVVLAIAAASIDAQSIGAGPGDAQLGQVRWRVEWAVLDLMDFEVTERCQHADFNNVFPPFGFLPSFGRPDIRLRSSPSVLG
jgi:Domain of unknown function (DUF4429)